VRRAAPLGCQAVRDPSSSDSPGLSTTCTAASSEDAAPAGDTGVFGHGVILRLGLSTRSRQPSRTPVTGLRVDRLAFPVRYVSDLVAGRRLGVGKLGP
jgi:hypothetical protein